MSSMEGEGTGSKVLYCWLDFIPSTVMLAWPCSLWGFQSSPVTSEPPQLDVLFDFQSDSALEDHQNLYVLC